MLIVIYLSSSGRVRGCCTIQSRRKICEMEEKPFTSSSIICPEACCWKEWGAFGITFPCHHPKVGSVAISFFKDDVTIILLFSSHRVLPSCAEWKRKCSRTKVWQRSHTSYWQLDNSRGMDGGAARIYPTNHKPSCSTGLVFFWSCALEKEKGDRNKSNIVFVF